MATQFVTILGNRYNIVTTDRLYLDAKKITTIPSSVFKLTNLELLDGNVYHSNNGRITEIPSEIQNLTKLKEIHFQNNKITEIPDTIGNLQNLLVLNLRNNQITQIPDSVLNLPNLKVIDLFGNPLTVKTIIKLGEYLDRIPDIVVTYNGNYVQLDQRFINTLVSQLQHNGRMGEYVMTKTKNLPKSMTHLRGRLPKELSKYLMGENLALEYTVQEAQNRMNSLDPREAARRHGGKKHKKKTRKYKKKRSKMTHKKRRR